MGRKSVVWAGCLLPVLAGCGSVPTLTSWLSPPPSPGSLGHDTRADANTSAANAAWTAFSGRQSNILTEEFHEGFVAGYADYLSRVPAAQPPADSDRPKKTRTPDGADRSLDYGIGFQYGVFAATAGGRRGPVPQANVPPSAPPVPAERGAPAVTQWNKISSPKPPSGAARPPSNSPAAEPPTETARAVRPLPKPELPIIPPFNPDLPEGGKLAPIPVPAEPDRVAIPAPQLPAPGLKVVPLPVPSDVSRSLPTIDPLPVSAAPPAVRIDLAAPPSPAPVLPAPSSVPAILENIPPIPFRPTIP